MPPWLQALLLVASAAVAGIGGGILAWRELHARICNDPGCPERRK